MATKQVFYSRVHLYDDYQFDHFRFPFLLFPFPDDNDITIDVSDDFSSLLSTKYIILRTIGYVLTL